MILGKKEMSRAYKKEHRNGGAVVLSSGNLVYVLSAGEGKGYKPHILESMIQLPCNALKLAASLGENPLKEIRNRYGNQVATSIGYAANEVAKSSSEKKCILRAMAQLPSKADSLVETLNTDLPLDDPEFVFLESANVGREKYPTLSMLSFYRKLVKQIRDCIRESGDFSLQGGRLVSAKDRKYTQGKNDGFLIGAVRWYKEGLLQGPLFLCAEFAPARREAYR